ncbi:MAG: hypothetical protein IJ417_04630 [Bacteroidaceae bacterium]|nr:hypothetical protein [Bacteroidaceae bacterium]
MHKNLITPMDAISIELVWNVLTRWSNSLKRFSKLDSWSRNQDCTLIASFIKTTPNRELANRIRLCRDAAIMSHCTNDYLMRLLEETLELLSLKVENTAEKFQTTDRNYGQTERYAHVTKELYSERLKFKEGRFLRNMDVNLVEKRDSKKIRRIVEKRMCQAYYRTHKRSNDNTNRHHTMRAISFQLYNLGQIVPKELYKREESTHWRYDIDEHTGHRIMRQKHGYTHVEDAESALLRFRQEHPEDNREIHVYLCKHCGKFHIGHTRIAG